MHIMHHKIKNILKKSYLKKYLYIWAGFSMKEIKMRKKGKSFPHGGKTEIND